MQWCKMRTYFHGIANSMEKKGLWEKVFQQNDTLAFKISQLIARSDNYF